MLLAVPQDSSGSGNPLRENQHPGKGAKPKPASVNPRVVPPPEEWWRQQLPPQPPRGILLTLHWLQLFEPWRFLRIFLLRLKPLSHLLLLRRLKGRSSGCFNCVGLSTLPKLMPPVWKSPSCNTPLAVGNVLGEPCKKDGRS